MLICTKCNIEYEEGKKFCKACGSPLAVKEEPQTLEPIERVEPKETEGMLICPQCQVPYETGKFCRKCGSVLIKHVPPQKKEEPVAAYPPKVKTEPPGGPPLEKAPVQEPEELVCPSCKASYPSGKFCKKCGSPLTTRSKEIAVEPAMETPQEVFQQTPPPQPPEQPPVLHVKPVEAEEPKISYEPKIAEEVEARIPEKKPVIRKIPSAKKKEVFRPLYIGVASAIVLIAVAGYLLWPKYSYLIKKQPPSSTGLVQKVEPPPDTHVAHPPLKTQPITPKQPEAKEVEAIKNLLENIRQANLQKNIDLFMSCYALEFKDREGRKATTLENWKNFDYLELSYDLKSHSISGDTANARVEWFILTSPKGGGQAQETKAVLNVTFKKENGGWKIKEIKSAG
ncbi:MAG: zinc ribbon domain-containing protein [Deltaproteobacteria bacterium]|nr:zinc ribbon domain-containing protein [Deltaproteobacteria bacterium]